MEARRVREREYDGSFDVRGHFLNYFFGESFGFGGGADQDVGLDFFDYGEKV